MPLPAFISGIAAGNAKSGLFGSIGNFINNAGGVKGLFGKLMGGLGDPSSQLYQGVASYQTGGDVNYSGILASLGGQDTPTQNNAAQKNLILKVVGFGIGVLAVGIIIYQAFKK
jgi:hypothetical protein